MVPFRNCFCGEQSAKFMDGSFLCWKHWEMDKARTFQDPAVTAANIKESNARSEKNRYAKLKEAGLCVTCGKAPNFFGCIRCETCKKKRRVITRAARGKLRGGVHPWRIASHFHFSKCQLL